MKKISCMVAMMLAFSVGVVFAQRGDPSQFVDRQITAMKERLKITDDQEKKIRPILADSMKEQMELRKKYNVQQGERPSQEAMEAMKKSREEVNKKLGEVLSKEQMADYQKMMAERMGGGGRKKQQ